MKLIFTGLILALAAPLAPAAAIGPFATTANFATVSYANRTICGPFTASCDGSFFTTSDDGQILQVNYLASAVADIGVLRAFAQNTIVAAPAGSIPLSTGNFGVTTLGEARYRDQLSLSIAPGTGSLGFSNVLTFVLDVSGTFTGSRFSLVGAYLNARNYTLDNGITSYSSTTLTAPGQLRVSVPFDVQQANDILIGFQAYVLTAGSYRPGEFGQVDVSHTAVLTGLFLTDASGNSIPFALTTASNSPNYDGVSLSSTATPEPATAASLLVALALMAWRRR